MTSPPDDPQPDARPVPPHVALVRIGSVIAMSTAAAFGIFLIVGDYWQWGLVSLACALPFFWLMRFAEGPPEPPEPPAP